MLLGFGSVAGNKGTMGKGAIGFGGRKAVTLLKKVGEEKTKTLFVAFIWVFCL